MTSDTIRQRKSAAVDTRGGSDESSAPATETTPTTETPTPTTTTAPPKEDGRLTKFRKTIFPIHGREEVIKFLLIGSIKFFIILALTLTRDTKDTLVVTQCGAEAIAFLKVSVLYLMCRRTNQISKG